MSIILGVDPGTLVTGFGLVRMKAYQPEFIQCGVIRMKDAALPERLGQLGQNLCHVLEQFKPEVCALEDIFLARNVDSAFKLGHARGVIMYECAKRGIPVVSYATRVVKKGVTGKGSASKEEVKFLLEKILRVDLDKNAPRGTPLDASDALALAVHHAFVAQTANRVMRAKEI